MANETKGAVHLTSLDLDLTQFNENIRQIEEGTAQAAETAVRMAEQIKQAFNMPTETVGMSLNTESLNQSISSAKNALENFRGTYKNISKEIQSSDLFSSNDEDSLKNLVKQLGIAEDETDKFANSIEKLKGLFNNLGEYTKINISASGGELFQAIVTQSDKAGNSIRKVIDLTQDVTGESIKSAVTITNRTEMISKSYEALEKRIASLIATMSQSNINTPDMANDIAEAKQLKDAISERVEALRNAADVETDELQKLHSLTQGVNRLHVSFSDSKTSAAEFKNALEPIKTGAEGAVASIRTLEKAAVFKSSKKNVAELRLEYEEFLIALKNGTITSVDEAKKKFDELSTKFDDLEASTLRSSGAMENFVNKISESAKWQIANSALNLLQQAFGNLVGTITTTEDSVIELRRVLNDSSITDSAMQQELYNIAYEFGQTFDNVQEVAVKFAQTGKSWQETIDATRATMLGLNTAELEVTTATEGLIATMAQFNIDASDLEAVIDKVNITADNFPVTSEKIVAALQRAGGTAHAFNMTLEETIATITALAEKTGRSGENIGTALNSLIIFTNKSENLELFAGLSEQMDEIVNKFQAGSASVIDIWTQLSKEIDHLTEQQEAALFDSTAYEEFASQFEAEAAEYAGTIQDIYGTAGAYRRNYLTVLLQDMSTVEDVMDNLTGAIGYSMQENETAMEAFSKKWNQLIIAAQELAVQFGNSGFLDLMKGATEAATAILKLTKNIGGLNTLLLAASTLIIGIKRQKINDYLAKQDTILATTRTAFIAYNAAVEAGATGTKAFAAALGAVKLSAGGVVTLVVGVATAIYGIANAAKQANIEAAKLRKELMDTGKESFQASIELANDYSEFDANIGGEIAQKAVEEYQNALSQLANSRSDEAIENVSNAFNKVKESADKAGYSVEEYLTKVADGSLQAEQNVEEYAMNILSQFNYQKEDIPVLVERYGSLEEAVRSLAEAQWETQRFDAEQAYKAATESVEDYIHAVKDFDFGKMDEQMYATTNLFNIMPKSVDEARNTLETLKAEMERYRGTIDSTQVSSDKYYLTLKDQITGYENYINAVDDAEYRLELYGNSIDEYVVNLRNANIAADEALGKIDDAAAGIPGVKVNVDELKTSISALQDQFSILSGKVDKFQSAYQTVQKVIKEYNETGVMSADMLQTIMGLEPEYIEMLNIQGDSLSMNEQKVHELMQANEDYLVQLEALRIAEQIQNMMLEIGKKTTEDMTEAQIAQKIASQQLSGSLEQAILSFMKGETTADQLDATLRNIAVSSGLAGNQINFLSGEVANLTGKMVGLNQIARITQLENTSQLERRPGESDEAYEVRLAAQERQRQKQRMEDDISALKGLWSTTSSGGGSSKASSTNKETDALKAQKEALDDLLDSYEHQIYMLDRQGNKEMEIVDVYNRAQEAMHEQAEKYRAMGTKEADKYADELSEKWWEYQDKIEDVLSGIYDATVNSHENALKLLDEQFTFYEERNDYSRMSKNLEKQLDYQTKIQQEAHKEAERLRSLGVDENDEAVQACIDAWWKADDAIQKINQQIEESILGTYDDFIDMADEFDFWEYMDFTKVDYLREKLAEINRLLENGTISLKEYNAQLKEWNSDMFAAQKERFSAQQDEIKKRSDDTVKRYKAEIDALKDQKTATSDYYDSVVDGYQAEIDAYDKRKDEVEDYYDTLLNNLNEVEAANERINAQMDYYNERQKIMTNLEQAQSRSGLEWREKEMEYQQQLNDLDENWRRQQQDWQIEDQTAALEEMREKTIAEIDLSIDKIKEAIEAAKQAKDAALDGIEAQISGIEELISATEDQAQAEIDAIEEQIKDLSRIIAESIKNGITDGFVDTQAEVDTAVTNTTEKLLAASADTNQQISNSANETANSVFGFYEKNFISPLNREIDKIANYMESEIPTSASIAAQSAFQVFSNLMFSPLKTAMSKLMSQTQAAKENVGLSAGTSSRAASIGTGTTSVLAPISAALRGNQQIHSSPYGGFAANNNVFINNYNQSQDESVRRSQTILQKFLSTR